MAGAPSLDQNPSLSSSSRRSLLPNGNLPPDLPKNAQEQDQQQNPLSGLTFLHKLSLGYTTLASQAPQLSPSKTFKRIAQARDMISIQTPSSDSAKIRLRDGLNLPGVGEIRWSTMKHQASDYLRNPKNLALLAWTSVVAVSGAILFMVMTGMLNSAIPSKSSRDVWFEVNNQILNALFTLMCLYLHPQRMLHLYQLYRWSRRDVMSLREIYCKDGLRKPHEWAHMLVVVVLLHLNCISQYALCGLNWGYRRSNRPAVGVAVCLIGAIGFAAGAGVYNILSPLGRDYVEGEESDRLRRLEEGEEMQEEEHTERIKLPSSGSSSAKKKFYSLLERRRSFALKDGKVAERPQWQGGVFDCCMDREVAVMTTVCGFCVFGWNMDRLGFGNRFVHIATFLLICSAPYWIFLLAAGNIDNRYVRQGLGVSGILLCVFGLMYGGFWRIRMRRTFGLPPETWCCGQANVADCVLWMFCSLCSLCQEVRTAAHYDIRDDKFYVKDAREETGSCSSSPGQPSPLGREQACKADVEMAATAAPRSPRMVAPSPVSISRGDSAAPSPVDFVSRSPCSPVNINANGDDSTIAAVASSPPSPARDQKQQRQSASTL